MLAKLDLEYNCNLTSLLLYPYSDSKDIQVLVSNEDYKIRIVGQHAGEPVIKKTCLGPTYGTPIRNMINITNKIGKENKLIAYSTSTKIFGLILLPIDGNPFRIMGVIGHPGEIKDIKSCKHSDYIMTTGGSDKIINLWRYKIAPLIENVDNAGEGIDPFLSLVDGGKTGIQFHEMVNFFYYGQIKSKDENTTKHRSLSEYIPSHFIYSLMCAMGYYPSQFEVKNMEFEIKNQKHEDGRPHDYFDFDFFVKLFVNHRPYKEMDYNVFETAFAKILKQIGGSETNRDKIFDLLKNHGNIMEESEINDCLNVLVGKNSYKELPTGLSAKYVFEKILGFEEVNEKEDDN